MDQVGWRVALAVLGVGGGAVTAVLHAVMLPRPHLHDVSTQVAHQPAPPVDRRQRHLRGAVLFEQAAIVATTAYLIGMLVDRRLSLGAAAIALGVMGLGKVAGLLLLLGPVGRRSPTSLAAGASIVPARLRRRTPACNVRPP